ncbi:MULTISPECIES: carbohydrate ABC transporter permease [Rathayibacter]|uniref:Carbohydrate ABC transporter permease n=2 Tax=Rathayibacter festucae TaxID=110937 RepID=A0A3Q9UYV2_9MICO|nr:MULTISPECIES: carbohydrate ABC transporter permease [Rathayibacter]AZZ53053.1 carbohydrate ABC transporter permease [Rathayibacter festucae DSM 15932]MCJ1671669.1 carbohydrate ABC transporter permease [Rathayibacter sp. VKM Ac-2929]MCJ1684159.1 carbohydrate ABC transporter permease [Rathayibacter sp. VKM Ac-2928]MCJ1686947.1 carbohydrate ABC transporter permease [Rathayibacter sp. VKM Ac-2927]QHC61628.1 ABC transporter permease subunit [Rathayibacter festucae]
MFELRTVRSRIGVQLLATVIVLPFLFALVAMVQGSLAGAGWGNYGKVFATGVVPTYFRNTIIVAVSTVAIVYVLTMLAAFGFAKLRIRGKEVWFWLLIAALTMPEAVLLTPLFVTASTLDVYNQLIAVILPLAALQVPFTVLLARSFFAGIPTELMDAGRVDGASIVKVFWYIVLPLTRPIAGAIVVLTLINSWNAFLLPLLMLNDPDKQVVTLLPSFFTSQYTNDQTGVLAASVITAVPVIVAYLLLQRSFERGLAAGALK